MPPSQLVSVTTSQLEYLIAALNEPTWKRAAEVNGVSPSALSQGIGELERRLGVRLFDREGRSRVPTADAHAAGRLAGGVIAELRELTRWAAEARGGGTGQISIGMIDTAAVHHFGETLVNFRREHPNLSVRVLVQPSNVLLAHLRSGEVDAIICVDPEPDDRLVLTPLIVEPLYIYAPPDATIGSPSDWGPWVSFPSDSRTRSLIARGLRAQQVGFDVIAESSQPSVLSGMVRLGMGWTVLSSVDAEVEPHALTRAVTEPLVERTLTLARRVDRTPNPALVSLLDVLTPG